MSTARYFKITGKAALDKLDELLKERQRCHDAMVQLCRDWGANGYVAGHGLLFKDGAPNKEWLPAGTARDGRTYYRPDRRFRGGKSLDDFIRRNVGPGAGQVCDIFGLGMYWVLNRRSGVARKTTAGHLAGVPVLIVPVPDPDESEELLDGLEPFEGHPDLTEISKAEYLRLEAAHEERQEAAA